MNPYVERASVWHDFHERWIPLAAEVIGAQVLPRYFVQIDQQMFIHELSAEERRFVGRGVDIESMSFLEIHDRESHELVSVIELVSPTNKYAGPDREQYLAKARRVQRSSAHFVEIDLLRGGPRMPWVDMACDYCVVVSRAERRPRAGIWPIRLRDPLPAIPFPLRYGEADIRLDLQQLLHRIYDAAGYAYYIYAGPPEPSLAAADSAWANQFIPAPK